LDTPGVADTRRAMPYVLRSHSNLDGAFAEKYSNIVGGLYDAQGPEFVRALGQLDPAGRDAVARHLAYYAYTGDLSGIGVEVEKFLESSDPVPADREAALVILRALEALGD